MDFDSMIQTSRLTPAREHHTSELIEKPIEEEQLIKPPQPNIYVDISEHTAKKANCQIKIEPAATS